MAFKKGNTYWKLVKNWKFGADRRYTPETLWQAFVEYVKFVENNPLEEQKAFGTGLLISVNKTRAMTLRGFFIYANMASSTFLSYEKQTAYSTITARIRDVIYTQKFEGAAAGLLESNIIARELGLADKSEISGRNGRDLIPAGNLEGLSKEELTELMADE